MYTSMSIDCCVCLPIHVCPRCPTRHLPQVLQSLNLSVEVSQPIHTPPHPFPRHFSTTHLLSLRPIRASCSFVQTPPLKRPSTRHPAAQAPPPPRLPPPRLPHHDCHHHDQDHDCHTTTATTTTTTTTATTMTIDTSDEAIDTLTRRPAAP
jgi:hypothetical protein